MSTAAETGTLVLRCLADTCTVQRSGATGSCAVVQAITTSALRSLLAAVRASHYRPELDLAHWGNRCTSA
jgi:hypothetical protein